MIRDLIQRKGGKVQRRKKVFNGKKFMTKNKLIIPDGFLLILLYVLTNPIAPLHLCDFVLNLITNHFLFQLSGYDE